MHALGQHMYLHGWAPWPHTGTAAGASSSPTGTASSTGSAGGEAAARPAVTVAFLPAGCDAVGTDSCTGFQMRGVDGVQHNAVMHCMMQTRFTTSAWTAYYPLYRFELTNMGLALTPNISFAVVTIDGTLTASLSTRSGIPVQLPFRFHLSWTLGYPAVENDAEIFRVAFDPAPLTFINSGNIYNFSIAGFLPWAQQSVGVVPAPALTADNMPVVGQVQPVFVNQTQACGLSPEHDACTQHDWHGSSKCAAACWCSQLAVWTQH